MDNGARGKLLAPVAWAAMGGIGVVLLWDGTDNVPGVREILAAFRELVAPGVLVRYTVASLFRVTARFYLAVAVSVPLGLFWEGPAPSTASSIPSYSFCAPFPLWLGFPSRSCGSASGTARPSSSSFWRAFSLCLSPAPMPPPPSIPCTFKWPPICISALGSDSGTWFYPLPSLPSSWLCA